MAKKKNFSEQWENLGARVDSIEIIQLPLIGEHVKKFVAWKPSPEQLEQALSELLTDGCEFSVQPNTKNGGYSAVLRGAYTSSRNSGKMYYSNAPTIQGAINLMVYKHFFVADSGNWQLSESGETVMYS